MPIRTYAELGIDSFESIVGAFAKINEIGEGAALQLIVRAASSGYKKEIEHHIEGIKKRRIDQKSIHGQTTYSMSAVRRAEVFNPKTKERKIGRKSEPRGG